MEIIHNGTLSSLTKGVTLEQNATSVPKETLPPSSFVKSVEIESGAKYSFGRFQKPLTAGQSKHFGPQASNCNPPPHARIFYKLVIMPESGKPMSPHDQATQYEVDVSYIQVGVCESEGALHVLSSLLDAVLKESKDAMLNIQRTRRQHAIAKVLAWNAERLEGPRLRGSKKEFSFFRVTDLLPVPDMYALRFQKLPLFGAEVGENKPQKPAASSAFQADITATTSSAKRASELSLLQSKETTEKLFEQVDSMQLKLRTMRGL
ncbi:hypothetical protein CEUSTIGMA_g2461.t1 [Chlamydomonas eustigma]|uniref:Uncharacterized protein n=1 Tax=Chlamydomonas eustigma TaxID=1157962 RepID=A0A250WW47_9CHLO|nr:hypothetical protein CEUSTIGMA_g2461.t1 [Chlamydomonas eustigma]|eukprot:GAX75015.1 hypothetical protein CEUSTIGMA_g2461.t1 [Chlamydomonas eustigma]